MTFTSSSLQEAVFQALRANNEIVELIGVDNIFDYPPSKEKYPYISIDKWKASDWSSDDDRGEQHEFDIVVYDENSSKVRLQSIAKHVISTLEDASLVLAVGTVINLRFENAFFEKVGRTRLQLVRSKFRAKIEY